jgi:hypothetical protein
MVALAAASDIREKLYNEMMDIYYAECGGEALYQATARHYERDWIHGWVGGFSNNPIAVGHYFYEISKAAVGTVYGVDVSAVGSITNTTKVYPFIQNYRGQMRLHGNPAKVNYTLHMAYLGSGPPIWVTIELMRNTTTGTYYFPIILTYVLQPGQDIDEAIGHPLIVTWYETTKTKDGNWTISLHTDPIGTAGNNTVYDTNTTNNKVDSLYKVRIKSMPADIEGSGKVDEDDLWYFCAAFIDYYKNEKCDVKCDFDGSGVIDEDDLWFFCAQFIAYYKYPLEWP